MEKAIVVGVELNNSEYTLDYSLTELTNLAKSLDIEVIERISQKLDRINPKYYIGSGKVEEIKMYITTYDINTVIFDDELSPSQIRNLEKELNVNVIDRTLLILDIFAKRASTTEAILEVRLAKLKYMLPRLVGLNNYMSRQGGSAGVASKGSGEKQIELDRRKIASEIVLLEEKYRSIKEIYSNNAKLYHDLNNHLNVLYTLLKEKNIEEAQQYITEIGVPIRRLSNISWTGNEVIDIIINYEIDKMKDKNIDYDIKACYPADTNLNAQDIGIMIGNLLDNAIEAMEKSKVDGKIKLSMKQIHQFLIIKVTNPCEENLVFSGLYPETTKEDKELHGWGLRSVSDIVDKYDGSLKCRNNEGVFEVNILLLIDSI